MTSQNDLRNEQLARNSMQAAKSAPHRKELELNQAEAFARLILDTKLRLKLFDEIARARNQ